ncbi:MAG: phosphatase, partial [Catalinimonas sp.]
GLRVRVIDGDREATYIYRGVREAVDLRALPTWLVMDIGGGSVEFIVCTDRGILWKRSFEVGAQRLLDRFMPADPIRPADVARLMAYLDEQLAPLTAAVAAHRPEALAGASGTFDTLVEMHAHATEQPVDWEGRTSFELPPDVYRTFHRQLLERDRAARLALPGMVEQRVDMIVVASCLIDFVLTRYDLRTVRVSTYALKEGVLATAAGRYPAL